MDFVCEDFGRLDRELGRLAGLVARAQTDRNEALADEGEMHENAAFEEADARLGMWRHQLMGLERLRRSAGLVDGRKDGRVGLGVTVGYVDLRTENTARLKVVGYAPVAGAAVIADGEVRRVSIAAPISQLLDGAAVGDVVEGALGSRRARLRITDVTRD